MDTTRRLFYKKAGAWPEGEDSTPLMPLSRTQTLETQVGDDDSSSESAGRSSVYKPRHALRQTKLERCNSDSSLAEGTSTYVRRTRHRRRWRLLCLATCGFVLL